MLSMSMYQVFSQTSQRPTTPYPFCIEVTRKIQRERLSVVCRAGYPQRENETAAENVCIQRVPQEGNIPKPNAKAKLRRQARRQPQTSERGARPHIYIYTRIQTQDGAPSRQLGTHLKTRPSIQKQIHTHCPCIWAPQSLETVQDEEGKRKKKGGRRWKAKRSKYKG
ncbi:hypothetical protein L209DRAFT_438834 [Thermothelomyces heterothallicus CBS 203.75]